MKVHRGPVTEAIAAGLEVLSAVRCCNKLQHDDIKCIKRKRFE